MNVLTGSRCASCEQVMRIVANIAAKVDLSLAIKSARIECDRLARSLLRAGVADALNKLVSEIRRSIWRESARSLCKAYEWCYGYVVPSRRTFARRYGGLDYAAEEAGVQANKSEGSRAGAGSRRRVFVADGRRVRGNRRAGTGCTVKGYDIESRLHPQRGGDRRRQLGNVLCLRQGKLRGIPVRRTICPRLRLQMRRLQRLRPWLQGL
jgi:hypothetical protein